MCHTNTDHLSVWYRVSSKQTKNISVRTETNQNKICFGLFHETKNFGLFWFISVFRTFIETINTNRTVSKQTETNQNNPTFSEKYQICSLSNCFSWSSVCFGSIETSKQTFSKQTKTNRNKQKTPKFSEKNIKICSLSNFFGWSSVCFGSIETWKLSVSV